MQLTEFSRLFQPLESVGDVADKPSPFSTKPAPNPLLPFLVVFSGALLGIHQLHALLTVSQNAQKPGGLVPPKR